jgi:hexosaminidase
MVNGKQNNSVTLLTIIVMLVVNLSCKTKIPTDISKGSLIPIPVSIKSAGGSFELKNGTGIFIQGESIELQRIGLYLAEKLRPSTGFGLNVKSIKDTPSTGSIYLTLSGGDVKLGDEGYELSISKDMIKLTANKPAGLFHGVQTIRQLLPPKIEKTSKQTGPWEIPTGSITDYPDYSYRGAMLDVARHFFGVEDVKKFIEFLAYYKMNALHLHLSDDQGWRIEIKSWPNLTKHGGSTQVGGGNGGFYTQEQYSEIEKFASERFITIIPEIDMPGHINAALSSYAELNCNGKATDFYTGIEVGFSTLCMNKPVIYKFVDDVIRELAGITTGPYIHIGGDESHVTKKEDYIPFMAKVQDMVLAHGKQVIGWDEVSVSGMKANSVAQFWANAENATRAVSQGAKILMSPAKKTYIDMKYDSTTVLGLHWAGYVEVDSAYIWDPARIVPGIGKADILGVEAPLWTETITKMDELEYMVFPRLPGLAEVAWSPSSSRNWAEYKVRLGKHGERFKAMDINYYPSRLVPWTSAKL